MNCFRRPRWRLALIALHVRQQLPRVADREPRLLDRVARLVDQGLRGFLLFEHGALLPRSDPQAGTLALNPARGMKEMGGDEDDRPSAEIGNSALQAPKKFDRRAIRARIFIPSISPSPPAHPKDSAVSRYDGRLARQSSLQEAIGYPSLHHEGRLVALLLGVIAEHVRQHLGIEDAARRRDERAEVLLAVESVAEADALGGKIRRRNARALIGGDFAPAPSPRPNSRRDGTPR